MIGAHTSAEDRSGPCAAGPPVGRPIVNMRMPCASGGGDVGGSASPASEGGPCHDGAPEAPAGQAQPGPLATGAEDARRAVLELAVEAAGVGTFDWDLVGGDLVFDERLLELFGYDEAGFDRTIDAFNDRVHPADLERVEQLYGNAIENCGDYDAEYRIVRPDGTTLWVAARGRAICDENGAAVRLIGVAYDATARQEGEARVARVMDSLGTAFFSLDRSWRLSYVNSEAERVLGRRREELLGGDIWDLFPAAVGSAFEDNYRHAMGSGEEVAFEAYYPEPLNAWYEVRAWPNPDGLAVYFLDVSSQKRAQQRAEQAVTRAALLAGVTETMSAVGDWDNAVRRLTQLVVPVLADWCIVSLIDDEVRTGSRRGLGYATGWHRDEACRPLVERYAKERLGVISDDSIVAGAVENAEAQYVLSDAMGVLRPMFADGPVLEMLSTLDPYSVIVLPLAGSGRPVGMITLCNGPERGTFPESDIVTARDLAARAGLVLDRARLYRRQREVAQGLQRSLLTAPPEGGPFEVAVRYSPAAEAIQVGGDWYDAFFQADGGLVLVIGDVMGHDIQAAAAMGQVRTLVRGIAAMGGDGPAEVLTRVDRVMATLRVDTTATAVVARVFPVPGAGRPGRVHWSNAGHPPPMLLRADGRVEVLGKGPSGPLLGVAPETVRAEEDQSLDSASVVLLYTDGLVERRGQSIETGLGELERALASLAGCALEDICDGLLERLLPERLEDDVALVAVRLRSHD